MVDEGRSARRIFVNGELMSEEVTRARGGGPKYHPRTFEEAKELLEPQVAQIRDQVRSLDPALRVGKVVVEAEVWANYLANSYYPARLVDQLKFSPLGSKITDGAHSLPSTGETPAKSKAFLLAVDEESLDALSRLLSTGGATKAQQGAADELRQFNNIRLSEVRANSTDERSGTELSPYEVVLHPDPVETTTRRRVPASDMVLSKFTALVESVGGRMHSDLNDTVDGLTFVAVDLPPGQVAAVSAFNPLRSITPTPSISLLTTADDREEPAGMVAAVGRSDGQQPQVLVFDGGVDDSAPLFKDVVKYVDLTGRGLHAGDPKHGTAVTAAVLYGDLGQGRAPSVPAALVTHYQVFPGPAEDASEFPWILRQIREKAENTDARIINLSLGPKAVTEDGEPHRWTSVLDKIAHNRGILFVTAAGNNGERSSVFGLNRVQVPGDMVNGLSVGATDVPAGQSPWSPASYSGRGPGRPGARVQPSVLAYGGTPTQMFGRVRADGRIYYDDWGTSYAAPLVTNVLARLSHELGSLADAPTLRALAAHCAEKIDTHDVLQVGHGRLSDDIENLLTCTADEATVIYQGLIGRDEVLGFALPYPHGNQSGLFDLKWTLAFTSATDSAEAGEYTKAGLEATFRPHSSKYGFGRVDPVTGKYRIVVKHLRKDSQEISQLLASGWKPGNNPASRSPKKDSSTEKNRRDQGKWESLWRAEDSLQAGSLEAPRIDISHVTREGGRITSDTEDIEFTLIATVKSRTGLPVYSQVQTSFAVLAPLPTPGANVQTGVHV